jgi:hypothetical protein
VKDERLPAPDSRLPAVSGSGQRRVSAVARVGLVAPASVPAVLLVLWLAGAVVVWNSVFDAHIARGARDYVDHQQLFVEGRGPRQDMAQSMAAARASGQRAAAAWAAIELVPGAALWMVVRFRRRHPLKAPH